MAEKLKIEFPSQGWRQFLTARKEMLDAFDRAREKAKVHEVESLHGRVAEAAFRKWLSTFLPKKYGVTSGFIISPGLKSSEKAPHFDVIVYNQLDSPVLWIEDTPDSSSQGRSLAIPVEHVQAVLEVKSRFRPSTVNDAIEHLRALLPLMSGLDAPDEIYKLYLPATFCCGLVFFELDFEHEFSETALSNLLSGIGLRGFFGGMILRGEGHSNAVTARIGLLRSETPLESTIGRDRGSLLRGSPISKSVKIAEKFFVGCTLMWLEPGFAQFAFDLIAMMEGRYRAGMLSSFYGLGASHVETDW